MYLMNFIDLNVEPAGIRNPGISKRRKLLDCSFTRHLQKTNSNYNHIGSFTRLPQQTNSN